MSNKTVIKYRNSGDPQAALGSLCHYFAVFMVTQVFDLLFAPVLSVRTKLPLLQFKSIAAYLICGEHKAQITYYSFHPAFTNNRV